MTGNILLKKHGYQLWIGTMLLILSILPCPSYAIKNTDTCYFVTQYETNINHIFDNNGEACFNIFFEKDILIKGTYAQLSQLNLLTDQDEHLRKLDSTTKTFMFTVPKSGNYQLIAQGTSNQSFNINLEIIPTGIPKKYILQSPKLIELEQQLQQGNNIDEFWNEVTKNGTPLIEPYDEKSVIMTFLWKGDLQNIKILGSPTGDHDDLYRLEKSNIWFRSYIVPKSTRFSYQLAPNIPTIDRPYLEQRRAILATAQQDPLNPNVLLTDGDGIDKFHRSSYIVLSDAPLQFGTQIEAETAKGHLTQHNFISKYLNNEREITIYWPAQIKNINPDIVNLVILFDSKQYQQKTAIVTIMDNLIANQRIQPTIVVMIDTLDNKTRSQELPPITSNMADCLAKELLPWLNEKNINISAEKTVVAGSSYGGLASAYIAFIYPNTFPNVLSLSGSYWWGPQNHEGEWLSQQFANQPVKPIRFYLNAGLFEGNLLMSNRHFRNILQAKGYQYYYHETASGHDYFHWQGEFAEGLQFLLNKDR